LQKPGGLIDETQAFATAVMVALGTDRLALADDILPGDEADTDRRGWWADTDCEAIWNAWPIGCRLWLLYRHKITGAEARQGATLARVEQYIREAMQPFVDRRLASRFDVRVERSAVDKIVAYLTIYRGPLPAIELQYQALWNEIGG
jgi:phage gp46-like protein